MRSVASMDILKSYLQESKTKVKKPNNSLQIWECMIYYQKKTLRNAQCSSSISPMQIRQALQYHKQEVKMESDEEQNNIAPSTR